MTPSTVFPFLTLNPRIHLFLFWIGSDPLSSVVLGIRRQKLNYWPLLPPFLYLTTKDSLVVYSTFSFFFFSLSGEGPWLFYDETFVSLPLRLFLSRLRCDIPWNVRWFIIILYIQPSLYPYHVFLFATMTFPTKFWLLSNSRSLFLFLVLLTTQVLYKALIFSVTIHNYLTCHNTLNFILRQFKRLKHIDLRQ